MNRNEIFEQLKDILVSSDSRYTQVIGTCTEATNVRTELGLSSTGMLYVLIAMEETFGAIFDDASANTFETIGDIVTYIQERVK